MRIVCEVKHQKQSKQDKKSTKEDAPIAFVLSGKSETVKVDGIELLVANDSEDATFLEWAIETGHKVAIEIIQAD